MTKYFTLLNGCWRIAAISMVAIVLLAGFAAAAEPGHGGNTKQSSTVTGRISIASTFPLVYIAGAYVEFPELGKYAYTDTKGIYTIRNVPWGSMLMQASATGYTSSEHEVIVGMGGDTTVLVDFTLALAAAKWLVMYYGDYDLNLDGWVHGRMAEFMTSAAPTADVKILGIFDRNVDWETDPTLNLSGQPIAAPAANNAGLYEIANHEALLLQDLGELDMGNPKTLSDFVTSSIVMYPASNYAVWIFGHGTAWQGVCPDVHSSVSEAERWEYMTSAYDQLTVVDLKTAFSAIKTQTGEMIDLVGFEACNMQSIEVAHQLRQYARVMVGSEPETYGWPASDIVTGLFANPSMSARAYGADIVNRYAEWYYAGTPDASSACSAIDLLRVEDLAVSLNSFSQYLYNQYLPTKRAKIESSRLATQEYDFEQIDLYDFVTLIEAAGLSRDKGYLKTIADTKTNFASMLIAEYHGLDYPKSHGLSIYFPRDLTMYQSNHIGPFDWYGAPKFLRSPDFASGDSLVDAVWWWGFIRGYLDPYDLIDPCVRITSPTTEDRFSTTEPSITISGASFDVYVVTRVEWSFYGSGVWQSATGTTSWSVTLNLVVGNNLITMRAFDANGNYQDGTVGGDIIIITRT